MRVNNQQKENEILNHRDLLKRLVPVVPELRTDRLKLDEIKREDIPAYNSIILDRERNRFWGYDDVAAQEDNKKDDRFYEVVRTDFNNHDGISFAVRLGQQMIGEAVLYDFDDMGGAELGCRIDQSMSGHGYGKEAFQMVLNWSLQYLKLSYIKAKCFHENKASCQMLSSCMDYISQDDTFYYFKKVNNNIDNDIDIDSKT